MTAPHIDDTTHGNIRWFHGKGPVPVQPYTGDCQHWGLSVIAWGWDEKHYELNTCDLTANGQPGCGSRAWTNPRGIATTQWMQPQDEAKKEPEHHHHLVLDPHRGWSCTNCGEEFPLDYRGGKP